MATTNQEDSLLSVIVQLPKSSRESSPGHPAHSPFCAVSDDGGAHPRYADLISEPEDVEVIDKTKLYDSTNKRYEQVTDLDEESETEDLNVSVADRVSKFLATSQAVSSPKEAPEKPTESPKTERKEVLKAKHMFETIAKNQTAPPAPNNKPVDILSRPSVFEGRQGVTTPKDKFDTFPKTKATKSSESLNKTASTNDLLVENHETHVDIEENTSQQFIKNETTNVLKEIQIENIDSNTKSNKIIAEEKKETTTRDKTRKTSSPEKEIQPRKSSIKDTPKKQAPVKYPGTENKEAKTSEIRESKISSKKDFFERKANAEKNTTLNKERPLRKEPAKPKKPSDTQVKSTDFIQNERKTSPSPRASPERKPVTKRPESPEVKRAQTKTVRENSSTEITTRKQSTERRSEIDRKSASSPTKERKDSPRASPDKQSPERSTPREKSPEKVATSSRPSSPTKKAPSPERSAPSERKPSLKRSSPEREAPSERKSSLKRTSPERDTPSERKSSLKRTSPEREAPSERKSSLKRSSPERKVSVETRRQSQERTVVVEQGETVELNKAGRFGVTLKRTASTTSAATPRRSSTPGTEEIEDILQLELLEQMLEKAVGYETRRRIRAQIRIVKKMIEDGELQVTSSTSTRTTTTSKTTRSTKSPVKELESKPQTKPVDKKPETKKPVEQRPATPVQRPASPTKHKVEVSSLKSTFEKSTYEPSSKSTFEQKGAETTRAPSPTKPQDQQTVTRTETVKKTTRVETSSTNVRSQPREREPCPITSSYGVGPTDDEGRPLFGLKALRRSNTAKTLTDEPATADQPSEAPQSSKGAAPTEAVDGVFDARGRPLFGLRALQVSAQGDTPAEMPEVSSTQIRGLVNKHQQNARTSHKEMESKTTVVTSKSVVSSDGSVSVNREVIKGELSSRNGEEPTGRIVHSKYSYQTPDDSNKSQGVSSTVTTTKTIGAGGRRSSGPKITELEDSDERRSSVSSSRRYSGAKVTEVEDDEERRGEVESTRGSSSECDSNLVSSVIKKFSGSKTAEADDKWQKSSSVTSKFVSTSSTSSTSRKANSTVTESKPKSFSPTPQQKSSDDDEDKKKPLVRGDSIRALQHKFQQATESAANGAPQRGYPPAGLILRTSSFKTTEESPNMSSSLKQHSTSSSTETKQRPNRTSSSSVTVRRNSKGDSSVEEKSVTSSSHTTTSTSSTSRVASSEKTSFLDNTSRVTGVQDILQRMRNADLVVESGDTDEDTEARALLNKFLGASVILQGMEQGMKAAAKTNGHTPSPLSASSSPTSATLVSRVEKQRIASSNTNQLSEEELENIWDEKQLRNLLEACSDYEGRRRIRARLRAVMAEQKVCADVVAVAASDASGNSMLSQGELPVSILRSQSSQSSGVDDSGTESGEDLRLLSPEVLAEVQGALGKLETALPSLDPGRREALLQLVSRLQTCLQIPKPATPPNPPPRRFPRVARRSRHTVGVSREELADARRWLQETNPTPDSTPRRGSETLTNESLVSKVFRPVKFNPIIRSTSEETYFESSNPLEEHPIIEQHFNPILYKAEVQYMSQTQPLLASVSYVLDKNTERLMGDATGSSILEYDPSSVLFTPEQSVQIAVHKAAINKQIFSKEEEKRREDSDDEEFSSTEDDHHLPTNSLVSSAQRLLLMASDNRKVSSSNLNRFHTKNNKKMKMKRANTIDIPKPQNYYDVDGSSCDEFDRNSVDDGNLSDNNKIYRNNHSNNSNRKLPFTLEPKTANDFKFLAFLQQTSERENNAASYNPCARGGAQWSNRFSNIKTAFEPGARRQSNPNVSSVNKSMWHNLEQQQKQQQSETDKRHTRTPQPIQKKLPWTNNSSSTSHQNENVVIGSITVAKKTPGPINQFSHAPKSAFKPPEKKTIPPVQPYNPPSASGTVKLLASQKFSGQNPSPKPILKQYPPQDKILNSFKPKSTNKDLFQKQPDDCRGFVPYTKLHHEVTQVPKVPQPVEKVDNNSQIKPYYIQPQKIENHRVSKVVKSLESEKSNEVAPVPPPKPAQSHHVFKHHLVKIPDESFSYSAPMNSNLYDRLTPEVSSINNRPFMDDKITNYRSNYEDNEDRYPQTHFIPASPPIQNPSNLYIPHSLPDTGYSSSSLKSNSSFEYSPSSPNRVANNCFPHNFSPQRTGGVLESRTSSIENELNIASDAISPLPSQYYVGQVQNNLLRIPSNLPTGRSSKTSSIDEDESASASPSFWANEEVSKIINPCDQMESQTAVTRVMGQPHTAVTVTNKMRHRHESAARKIESHILSAAANPSSPSFPNVLQKSESWHQMVKEKMAQAKQAPPLPKIPKAKSSHALAFPKQFEAAQPKELLQSKQSTVDQYLKKSKSNAGINKLKERRSTTKVESTTSIRLDEDLRNVDEAFESLFNETSKRRSNK
ncbi:serine/arginine repetitive matrix protein 2 [Nilaparvata lugens]|uniref:serine/arginine repetitive matrix protein 2 n=1 Tax=Nilaparvata lugens TaxID=108931 RepID=UPI00193DCE06|nr:serine/arginine repetitive matrix protein 2 [Nilaparvata lugens]